MLTIRRCAAAGVILAALTANGLAQVGPSQGEQRHPPASPSTETSAAGHAGRGPEQDGQALPAEKTTHHSMVLPDRTLAFTASAGAVRLRSDDGTPQADVAYVAYRLDGVDPRARPVAFVFNGGPGMASGWLQVGALGPWRIPFGGTDAVPSASPEASPNAETWLDFTDLVFIDPPGTGYSTILAKGEEVRRRFWSISGDVDAFAEAIRLWLDHNDRIVSPKYLVGESYGGFRAPRLARTLQSDFGVGVSGIVLMSPLLDTQVESGYDDPLHAVDLLPTETAAARALKGPVDRAGLADAEQYAVTDYVEDLMRGVRDAAAVSRMSDRVAGLTGIDRAIVERYAGRLDREVFLHELARASGRVSSVYDATVSVTDPDPRRPFGDYPDPILEGLKAPVTSAMASIYEDKLLWRPEAIYRLENDEAFRAWNWGRGMGRPESLSYLQRVLSLDPRLRVLIAQGLFDMRTPYFATVRLLNQLPDAGTAERVKLEVYPGGHMFYSEDKSRAAFRAEAGKLFQDRGDQYQGAAPIR